MIGLYRVLDRLRRPAPLCRLAVVVAFVIAPGDVAAQDDEVVRRGRVLEGYDFYRSAGWIDPLELAIVRGKWQRPSDGAFSPDGLRRWQAIEAGEDGWLRDPRVRGGYVHATVESMRDRVVILEAMAHRMVYVNGEPRAGNLYQYKETREPWEPRFDYAMIPVLLREGINDLLFQGGRLDAIKIRLQEPRAPVLINDRDLTAPDFLTGAAVDDWAAVPLINASTDVIDNAFLVAHAESGDTTVTPIPPMPPLGVFKLPFRLKAPPQVLPGEARVLLEVMIDGRPIDNREITLQIREPHQNHRRTFVSGIDGSVQYFAINPAQSDDTTTSRALFLSVHGAAVEAINQSGAYKAKTWGHVVAPTNRRPYGYNWEDWGRHDALEVLDIAMTSLDIDRSQVYLTGHSMGGHGTWHIGALFTDRFGALGPSAGWISFWSYRPSRLIEEETPIEQMLMRATSPSRTLALADNYRDVGVYVLHGADDDNVPATESRLMVERLATFHKDYIYHEEPDAGHWWDKSKEDGADCVDWQPMFDFFARRRAPSSDQVRRVRFKTPSPGVSASRYWVTIEAQTRQLAMSAVDIRYDPGRRRFVGHTDNVERFTLDLAHIEPSGPLLFELDGEVLGPVDYPSGRNKLTLKRTDGRWVDTPPAPPTTKGPARYGTFKDVFNHRVLLVYGTVGNEEENRWALSKARYDAETFWYQANGAITLVRDVDFDPRANPDRNVVLYGNEKTNAAWSLVGSKPLRVRPDEIKIGKKKIRGDDLGILAIRPRRGSATACVGVVGGTGIVGMRLTDRRPYLQAGFAYPDVVVFCPPEDAGGIVCGAGFFGLDWRVETGDFVWSGRAD